VDAHGLEPLHDRVDVGLAGLGCHHDHHWAGLWSE
jgi:hypothetical protein